MSRFFSLRSAYLRDGLQVEIIVVAIAELREHCENSVRLVAVETVQLALDTGEPLLVGGHAFRGRPKPLVDQILELRRVGEQLLDLAAHLHLDFEKRQLSAVAVKSVTLTHAAVVRLLVVRLRSGVMAAAQREETTAEQVVVPVLLDECVALERPAQRGDPVFILNRPRDGNAVDGGGLSVCVILVGTANGDVELRIPVQGGRVDSRGQVRPVPHPSGAGRKSEQVDLGRGFVPAQPFVDHEGRGPVDDLALVLGEHRLGVSTPSGKCDAVRGLPEGPAAGCEFLFPAAHGAFDDQGVLKLRHVGQESELDLEHLLVAVDTTVSRGDPDLALGGVVHPPVDVLHGAPDAVELAEDHEVDETGLDVGVHLVEVWAGCQLAGDSAVAVDLVDYIVALAELVVQPCAVRVFLGLEAEKLRLLRRRHPEVDRDANQSAVRSASAHDCKLAHVSPFVTGHAPGVLPAPAGVLHVQGRSLRLGRLFPSEGGEFMPPRPRESYGRGPGPAVRAPR